MNTMFRRDHTDIDHDHAAQQRHRALTDAIDHCRRASSASAAAACGEPDALRFAALESIQQHLCSLLAQLRTLNR
jgi:hypothetical protein